MTQSPTTALTLTVCTPSTPYKVPPGSGPPVCPSAAASYPYFTPVAYPTLPNVNTAEWNLLDGYLRVEYRDKNGVYHPVTQEWLSFGFARNVAPPTAPLSNTINPDAILLLQEPADRNGNGTIDAVGAPAGYTSVTKSGVTTYTPFPGKPPDVTTDATTKSPWYGDSAQANGQSSSQFNWYPINFYDAREGEPRDTQYANNSCTANGVMNAVELDVGNLWKMVEWYNSGQRHERRLCQPERLYRLFLRPSWHAAEPKWNPGRSGKHEDRRLRTGRLGQPSQRSRNSGWRFGSESSGKDFLG